VAVLDLRSIAPCEAGRAECVNCHVEQNNNVYADT